ncbi:MAG: hypothetical protein ACJ749_10775, partial [Flavisolibacter sp.]
KVEEELKDKGGLFNKGIKAAAVALPLIIAAKSLMGSTKCLSVSKIAMAAGGVALFVGDMMSNKKHKSCLKKIQDDWEKKKAATAETTSSGVSKVSNAQAQSEAFEMLAKKEDCMKSASKMKAGFYAAATAAFATTAVLSTMEIINLHTKKALVASTAGTPANAAAVADYTRYEAQVTCQAPPKEEAPVNNAPVDTPIDNTVTPAPSPVTQPPTPSILDQTEVETTHYKPMEITKEYFANLKLMNSSQDVASFMVYYNSLNGNAFDNYSSPSIDDYDSLNETFKGINTDQSFLSSLKMVVSKALKELNPIQDAHAFSVGSFLTRPEPRAVVSGILTAWSAIMFMHANKQAKVSANRAEFLRKMKQDFNDANGAISCTAEERSMSANANCYCYTEDGQRNSSRTNSSVCQQLWTGQSLAQAGTYNGLDFSGQRVCISSSGAPDENCACAINRSCLNAIPGATGNLGLGAISVASQGLKPLNDLSNGQIGAGSINGAAALSAAAKLLDQKNKLASKAGLNSATQAKLAKQVEDGIMMAGAGAAAPSSLGSSSQFPMNMTPAQAAQALDKEFGGRTFESIKGSPAVAQPGNSHPGSEPGFSLGNPEAVAPTTDQQVAEVMGQDFNYGQNDITKSDSNLFQILSNRYQRSGMRRLFDDKQTTAADPANKKDITP